MSGTLTSVGRVQGLLCPPTAGGGCSFCSSEYEILHGDRGGRTTVALAEDGNAHTGIDNSAFKSRSLKGFPLRSRPALLPTVVSPLSMHRFVHIFCHAVNFLLCLMTDDDSILRGRWLKIRVRYPKDLLAWKADFRSSVIHGHSREEMIHIV